MKALATALLGFCFVASAMADQTNDLAKGLEPLRPFLKTWKGHFKNSTPEKPVYDTAKWERAMNGQAVRVTHSVNDGRDMTYEVTPGAEVVFR